MDRIESSSPRYEENSAVEEKEECNWGGGTKASQRVGQFVRNKVVCNIAMAEATESVGLFIESRLVVVVGRNAMRASGSLFRNTDRFTTR
mmetsp:Transcript_12845/g.26003  ORF Transcript_12845/g.26003 Transcript_12845/m.26003 type:complete len:90 (+) Transcript_12845:60-329(+)